LQHNDHQDNLTPKGDSDIVTFATIWRIVPDFFAFLKRPFLSTQSQELNMLALSQLGLLLWLNIIFSILVAVLILTPYQEAVGIADNAIADDGIPFRRLFIYAVIAAPLIEEILFRGWLRGTRRALIIAAMLLSIGMGYFVLNNFGSNENIIAITMFLLAFLIAFEGFTLLRKLWHDWRPIEMFERYFPIIFYVSAFSFGLIHISNYEHHNTIELLPMVITQCFAGLLFGYVRLRFGLLAAIAMHAVFNGILVSLISLFPDI